MCVSDPFWRRPNHGGPASPGADERKNQAAGEAACRDISSSAVSSGAGPRGVARCAAHLGSGCAARSVAARSSGPWMARATALLGVSRGGSRGRDGVGDMAQRRDDRLAARQAQPRDLASRQAQPRAAPCCTSPAAATPAAAAAARGLERGLGARARGPPERARACAHVRVGRAVRRLDLACALQLTVPASSASRAPAAATARRRARPCAGCELARRARRPRRDEQAAYKPVERVAGRGNRGQRFLILAVDPRV